MMLRTPTLHPAGNGNSDTCCPVPQCFPSVGHFVHFIGAHWDWQPVVILVVFSFSFSPLYIYTYKYIKKIKNLKFLERREWNNACIISYYIVMLKHRFIIAKMQKWFFFSILSHIRPFQKRYSILSEKSSLYVNGHKTCSRA